MPFVSPELPASYYLPDISPHFDCGSLHASPRQTRRNRTALNTSISKKLATRLVSEETTFSRAMEGYAAQVANDYRIKTWDGSLDASVVVSRIEPFS